MDIRRYIRRWEWTEALERHRLLVSMHFAVESGNRHYADQVLGQATRWLRRHDDALYFECRGKDSGIVRFTFEMLETLTTVIEEEEQEEGPGRLK
jgi:hypothetical protein